MMAVTEPTQAVTITKLLDLTSSYARWKKKRRVSCFRCGDEVIPESKAIFKNNMEQQGYMGSEQSI